MGSQCCGHSLDENESAKTSAQKNVLIMALAINLVVLVLEVWAGLSAGSDAILADAVHLFGHVFVISLSLIALSWSPRTRIKAAGLKGALVLGLGATIVFEAVGSIVDPAHVPEPSYMSLAALIAFLGNGITLLVVARRRNDDLNMRSTWVCTQTDLLTNLSLLVASALVAILDTGWPDGVLGLILGIFVIRAALLLLKQVFHQLVQG